MAEALAGCSERSTSGRDARRISPPESPPPAPAICDNRDQRFLNTDGEVCSFGNNPYPVCYSRPVIFQVDESAMIANIAWADRLSLFSMWGGSINQLANGNVEFDLNDPISPRAQVWRLKCKK